jgi:hypothetical protein
VASITIVADDTLAGLSLTDFSRLEGVHRTEDTGCSGLLRHCGGEPVTLVVATEELRLLLPLTRHQEEMAEILPQIHDVELGSWRDQEVEVLTLLILPDIDLYRRYGVYS